MTELYCLRTLRTSLSNFASELRWLQRTVARAGSNPTVERAIDGYSTRSEFEWLVVDVLNEFEVIASLSNIYEDLLEKTDARVKYPDIKRRRGARLQITLLVAAERHEEKLRKIRRREELIIVSPRSLAKFMTRHEEIEPNQAPGPFSNWAGKSSSADVEPASTYLHSEFVQCLAADVNSPLGPMMQLSSATRALIRAFVRAEAVRSTRALRERQQDAD